MILNIIYFTIAIIVSLALGVGCAYYFFRNSANGIISKAKEEAEIIKRDKIIEAKEKFIALKTEYEKEINQRNKKCQEHEDRLRQREHCHVCDCVSGHGAAALNSSAASHGRSPVSLQNGFICSLRKLSQNRNGFTFVPYSEKEASMALLKHNQPEAKPVREDATGLLDMPFLLLVVLLTLLPMLVAVLAVAVLLPRRHL